MALTKISSGNTKEQGLLGDKDINKKQSYMFMKRLMDIIGALCGLIFLSPVFIIVAILIKLEDPQGPVFFKQTRVGKDEKGFGMYKFRSMVTDAEEKLKDLLQHNEVSGAMFKMKEDPRVTKVGKFIRKTSIDELPQLINVLKGEMSLVGPRPPLLREVKEYTTYDKQRLKVTPGCTGLWQVSGRSNIGFEEMVELDLSYIQNRNLLLDIKIIFKTVGVLMGSKDAF
ncbi:TPA: sugar transferase [Bacillus cereus]|uniref:sugar transferase n=1 Tax=Bacillus cereus group TaxID=86661 RepID=UPI000A21174C|nr:MULTISPECIES: sugar transferase [Bacillus cereus group]ARO57662.1 Exopolysaccharide biosynthesis polyprenyl glycosylphosphotransferase [Bacillus cereus]ARO63411.1 Exopolysaccharide biosynthesis polyprenyl glycosylphosphotransferase [Bacillus cereus]MED3324602.1 sugar transferase [Bacillus thuringiensis]PES17459.1 multidrug MFS transporter [Bacillus cereus]PFP06408.1 multidrug MFS transporter [Bacillus thuringiensis]